MVKTFVQLKIVICKHCSAMAVSAEIMGQPKGVCCPNHECLNFELQSVVFADYTQEQMNEEGFIVVPWIFLSDVKKQINWDKINEEAQEEMDLERY